MEKAGSAAILIRKIPLLGSVVKIKRCPADVSFDEIEKLATKYSTAVIKIEVDIKTHDPEYQKLEKEFKLNGYHDSNVAFCPTKTSYINLAPTEEEIFASFQRDAQVHIRKNEINGLKIREAQFLEEIYPLLEFSGKSRHFIVQKHADWLDQWGIFSKQAKVILAYLGDDLLGGNMFLVSGTTAFGIFLPLSEVGRKRHAAYTLMWEGFKLAKKEGCLTFDLEGIYDIRYGRPKEWLGLTAFKRKFCGEEVEFMRAKVKARKWYLKPFAWAGAL